MKGQSEVKGIWFVTARRYLESTQSADTVAAVVEAIPRTHRSAMAEPLTSRWYPEEAMQQSLHAVHRLVARGDKDKMLEIFEACTVLGVNHFFRIALRVTSTAFVVRMMPAMWDRLRRGPGSLTVDVDDAGATLRYVGFPYFADPIYRLLVVGTVRPLIRLSTGKAASVDVAEWTDDSLRALVRFG
jgi:hypothetical protein